MSDRMTPEQFKSMQKLLGWTNQEMAERIHKSPDTISNWRRGLYKIPNYVPILIEAAVKKKEQEQRLRQLALDKVARKASRRGPGRGVSNLV